RQEAQKQLAEIRAEVEQIRRDAADTDTGQTMRAALAYRMFQRMYADARAQGLTAKAPIDLVALVLGLDEDTAMQESTQEHTDAASDGSCVAGLHRRPGSWTGRVCPDCEPTPVVDPWATTTADR